MSLAEMGAALDYGIINTWFSSGDPHRILAAAYAVKDETIHSFPTFYGFLIDQVALRPGSGFAFGCQGWDKMAAEEQSAFFDYAHDLGVKVKDDSDNRRIIVLSPKAKS